MREIADRRRVYLLTFSTETDQNLWLRVSSLDRTRSLDRAKMADRTALFAAPIESKGVGLKLHHS